MRFNRDSVISFTPDHSGAHVVEFTQGGETWTEHIIGWAIVVSYSDDEGGTDTNIHPVVIDPADGMPATVTDYRDNRTGHIDWRVKATRDERS